MRLHGSLTLDRRFLRAPSKIRPGQSRSADLALMATGLVNIPRHSSSAWDHTGRFLERCLRSGVKKWSRRVAWSWSLRLAAIGLVTIFTVCGHQRFSLFTPF